MKETVTGFSELYHYLTEQSKQTTIQGFVFIFTNKLHWIEKLMWVISVVSASVCSLNLSMPLFTRYQESPTVMSVEMDYYNWNITFPAVSLCPNVKVDEDLLMKYASNALDKDRENFSSILRTIASLNLYTIDTFELADTDLIDPRDFATLSARVFYRAENVQLTVNTNRNVKIESIMTEMGMCHVINSNIGEFDNPEKWTKDANPVNTKNSVDLTVHDGTFFIQTVNYSHSHKIFIHSPDDLFESNSLHYTQEGDTFLTLNVFVKDTKSPPIVHDLSIKQRNCRYINESPFKRDAIYSYNRCIKECRIKMIKTLCGCVPHFYKPMEGERTCTLPELTCVVKFKKDLQHLAASQEVIKTVVNNDNSLPSSIRSCGCVQNCEEYVYSEDNIEETEAKLSLMRIGIENYPRVRFTREILFGFNDVLVRVGGVINLCLGMSTVSMAELILFFFIKPLLLQMIVKFKRNK